MSCWWNLNSAPKLTYYFFITSLLELKLRLLLCVLAVMATSTIYKAALVECNAHEITDVVVVALDHFPLGHGALFQWAPYMSASTSQLLWLRTLLSPGHFAEALPLNVFLTVALKIIRNVCQHEGELECEMVLVTQQTREGRLRNVSGSFLFIFHN